MRNGLPQSTIDEIVNRYKNGETYEEIVVGLKISEWTVKKYVNAAKKKGIIDPYNRNHVDYSCLGKVNRRLKNGESPETIATDMGMSLDKLNYIIHSGKKNLENRSGTTIVSKDQVSEINSVIELYLKNFNADDISTSTGVDKGVVKSYINKYATLKSNIFDRPNKKKTLTPELFDEGILMHINNDTITSIGDKLGMKHDMISKYMYAYDHVMLDAKITKCDSSYNAKIDDAELARLYNSNVSIDEIANHFGANPRSLDIHISKLLALGAIEPRVIERKEVDNDIMNTVVALVKEGNSIGVIHEKTGIDYDTVYSYRKKAVKRGLLEPSQGPTPVRLDRTYRKESILDDVLKLYNQNYTMSDIAEALGVSPSNVQMCLHIAKHKGLVKIRGRRTEKEIIEVINLHKDGKSCYEIARTTDIPYDTVRRIVSKYKNHVYDHLFSGGYNVIKAKGE